MASLSRAVSRLVARGLVERGRCLSWGRRTAAVRLTDAGRKWVKAHKAVK
jgi:DNA-binding MarR family transcriptional regulator